MHRSRPYRNIHLLRGGLGIALALGAVTLAHADFPAPVISDNELPPPAITVLTAKPGTARGLIFVAPKATPSSTTAQGPEIIDDLGRPVWFHGVGNGDQVADFRVQRYHGEFVLTWWQGQSHEGPGHGAGVDYIVDRSYHVIATVNAGNGLAADTHEFRLTPEGTALITVYHAVPYDLSAVGGPAAGSAYDGIVQEVDVATGAVVFEWHSLEHVALRESHAPVPADAATPYDYFHINAASLDHDGNLLVGARNTWAFYKVDRHTGHVLARVGGTQSDLTLGPGVAFAWQHDPEVADGQTVRLFDNEAAPAVLPRSRVIWLHRNPWNNTASLVRAIEHPDGLSAGSQGNAQALDNGNTFVGWGQTGRVSEFDARGELLFDASVPVGYDTYRAYRHVWHARPDSAPTITARRNSDGTTTVHAIWNGATDVARWIVVGGGHLRARRYLGWADWNGLDTTITLNVGADELAVLAQDASGRELGSSRTVAVAP